MSLGLDPFSSFHAIRNATQQLGGADRGLLQGLLGLSLLQNLGQISGLQSGLQGAQNAQGTQGAQAAQGAQGAQGTQATNLFDQSLFAKDPLSAFMALFGGNAANIAQPGQIPAPQNLAANTNPAACGCHQGQQNLQTALAGGAGGYLQSLFGALNQQGLQPTGAYQNPAQTQQAVQGLGDTVAQQAALQASMQQLQAQAHSNNSIVAAQSSSVQAGKPAQFPAAQGSDFINNKLGADAVPANASPKAVKKAKSKHASKVAKKLNVSGSKDVKRINQAVDMLKGASAKVAPAKAGETAGAGKLMLSQEQVDKIRNAPDLNSAKSLVAQAIEQQTGKKFGPINMDDQKGIRNGNNREALNALLGTKVRAGVEKNSGSSMVMDSILDSVAKSVRGGDFGTTNVEQRFAANVFGQSAANAFCSNSNAVAGAYGNAYGSGAGAGAAGAANNAFGGAALSEMHNATVLGINRYEFKNPSSALAVDLSNFTGAANKVGELGSPLIFDLAGTGLKINKANLITLDFDGDGMGEIITDLPTDVGLLVFTSDPHADAEVEEISGADLFGDRTDLTAYGIKGTQKDGCFANGFEALRALAEKFEMVRGSKQFLDSNDLAVLEKEVGLRMRVGGVLEGTDHSFASLGVTRINLGDINSIAPLASAPEDAFGNRLMHQAGATFTVEGQERVYADIWFNIQARAEIGAKDGKEASKSEKKFIMPQMRI